MHLTIIKRKHYIALLLENSKKVGYCTEKGTKLHKVFIPDSVADTQLPTDVAT